MANQEVIRLLKITSKPFTHQSDKCISANKRYDGFEILQLTGCVKIS